jgi:hypothetical protein
MEGRWKSWWTGGYGAGRRDGEESEKAVECKQYSRMIDHLLYSQGAKAASLECEVEAVHDNLKIRITIANHETLYMVLSPISGNIGVRKAIPTPLWFCWHSGIQPSSRLTLSSLHHTRLLLISPKVYQYLDMSEFPFSCFKDHMCRKYQTYYSMSSSVSKNRMITLPCPSSFSKVRSFYYMSCSRSVD